MGVDVGDSGAAVLLSSEGGEFSKLESLSFKTAGKNWPIEFHKWLRNMQRRPDSVWIERVGARPEQGAPATFKFGKNLGLVMGVLIGNNLPFRMVSPGLWTRVIWDTELILKHQSRFAGKDPKEFSRIMAESLWGWEPFKRTRLSRVSDSGTVDASLVALYGAYVETGKIAATKNVVETDLDFQNFP